MGRRLAQEDNNGKLLTARHYAVNRVPPRMSTKRIKELRREVLGVSQTIFAKLLNVALQTVRAWEQGTRRPTGSALRLLSLAEETPETVQALIADRSNTGRRPV